MTELLNDLFAQAQAIRPDVRFVSVECYCSGYRNDQFWAHTNNRAFSGDTPSELLSEIRQSLDVEVAA